MKSAGFMVYHWMLYFSSEPIQIYIVEVLAMKSAGFHEICVISWNPPDFMHEICQISWNLPNFMKSAGFHHLIRRISWYTTECCIFHQNQYRYTLYKSLPWNPPDFMHEIRPKWAKDPWSYFSYFYAETMLLRVYMSNNEIHPHQMSTIINTS